ncbi:hypothetical protein A7C99_2720 [Trichophyton rubrum]|uniref:Uncharacterized protein n=1 Tax=Trichophyton rubrum TaxID=5551 RepID=A0A178F1R7_TRIRU|nr:hypothetical protein A7C99_2720 [Trichophyton rubrum]
MADRSSSSTNQESNNDQTQSQSPHDSSTRNSDSDPFGLNKYIKPVSDPWSVYNTSYSSSSTPPGSTVKRRAGPPWPLREFNAFKPPARTHHEAGASRPPRHILFLDQASHAIDRKMLKRDPPKRHREVHPQPQPAESGMCEMCQQPISLQARCFGLWQRSRQTEARPASREGHESRPSLISLMPQPITSAPSFALICVATP